MKIGAIDVDRFRSGVYQRLAVAWTTLSENDGLLDKEKLEMATYLFEMMDAIEQRPPQVNPNLTAVPGDQQCDPEGRV